MCKCGGEFSKACQLWRRGTEQPLICAAVCREDAWALRNSTPTRRSLQSPCTHSHPHNAPRRGTINTKGLGCYSDMRAILPLAGPQSPHFPVNHLPNNEPQFTPPLFYLPLSSSHTAPSDTHKHTNYLVAKVPPLFVLANLIGPAPLSLSL